ncbi:MAG: hypothetical protein OXQ90_05060 [Gammaproteobacteria bacterium]|nr:hypothetical protein [Gammaproteobacteria bacterium]
MSLADKITVNTRYTRSTNVERDRGSRSIVEAYLPTARGVGLLEDITGVLGADDQPRAWSLIGPYGSGKSSFALFLHELLGDKGGVKALATKVLASERPDLARRFARQGPWCRVVLSGSEESFSSRLLAALEEAATGFWKGKRGRKPTVIAAIRKARAAGDIPDSRVLELVDSLQSALERTGAGGLLMVIDELGKFLEYEARRGGGGVFLLQQLAERAFRGRKGNLMLFVLLHQGFDLYARGMGEKLKNDWTKVQGRFQSVSFVETPEQTLRVVAAAFSNSLTDTQRQSIGNRARRIARAIGKANALPATLDEDAATDIFTACYPMHPVSLLVLPTLCQRFAQNERTLFSYLGSREPHGFRDSIESLQKVGDWVHPGEVYDYFVQNQPAVLADPLTHRRWAEVVTAVERAEAACETTDATDSPLALAKAIGVLNLVSRAAGLKASEVVLRHLFPTKRAFHDTVQALIDASIVQYRRFNGEYRVWQGTDFDIDERTDLEREKLGQFELAAALRSRIETAPVVVRRHSIETGALRYFELAFVDVQSRSLVETSARPDPRIVFFLAESRDDEVAFDHARQSAGPNDIWVLHKNGAAIRAAIGDVLALEGVQRGGQELASDPVASREIKERLQAAQVAERQVLNALTGNPGLSSWYWRGEHLDVPDERAFQRMLSDVMDRIYDQTPAVSNELINRERLSSQAAAARNKLFQHMLDNHDQAGLDIKKYPPERAIYRSVLQAGRLHVEMEAGWRLVEPDDEDPLNLRPVWARLDELFAESEAGPITPERLMGALAAPPFGLKRGLFPILFLHYYLLHRYEIAFYDEGTYAPTLTYEHLERLVRRPDLFSFQRFRIEGVRATLFDEYSKALFGEVRESVNLLDLARPLTSFVLGLDDHAQKTRRLSETTLRVRQAFFLSKSPEKFLFKELPRACGFDAESDLSGFADVLIGSLRELKGAQADLHEHMRSALCGSFNIPDGTPVQELRGLLLGRCHGLDQYTVDVQGLRSFIRRIIDRRAGDDEWFSRILLFLGHKPAAKWTDQDRDTAEYRLAEFSKRLLDLEKLRLHFDTKSKQESGIDDVIFVKKVSKSAGEVDEVVSVNSNADAAIASARERIGGILGAVTDRNLALALFARVADDFLTGYRVSEQSEKESGDGIRAVG